MRWGPERGKSNLASLRHRSALSKEKVGTAGSTRHSPLQDGADALSVQLHVRQQPLCLAPRFRHMRSEPYVSGLSRGLLGWQSDIDSYALATSSFTLYKWPLLAACTLLLPALLLNQGALINVI